MARIYLSHRRRTASPAALLIARALRKHFGQADVFLNTGNPDTSTRSILPLAGQLRLCRVMLVLIDAGWADQHGPAGRLLDDPHDPVRREVEAGLAGTLRVLPVLLEGAELPDPARLPGPMRGLCNLPALRFESGSRHSGLDALVATVREVPGMQRWRRWPRQWLPGAAAVAVVGLLLGGWQLLAARSAGTSRQRTPVPASAGAAGPAAGPLVPPAAVLPAPDPRMLPLPGGRFTMGSSGLEVGRFNDEGPQRSVSVAAFALSATPVTRGQFARFVADTHYQARGCTTWYVKMADWVELPTAGWQDPGFAQDDSHPAVCISWDDAQAYVHWLGKRTGQSYRLPSEAEWEYAARAGTGSARYWGEDPRLACLYANVADQTTRRQVVGALGWPVHPCSDGYAYTAPADFGRANAFGLSGMLGNAWQWTEDCWHPDYQGAPVDARPWTGHPAGDCRLRVIRGGAWGDEPRLVRCAARNRISTVQRFGNVGFRIARSLAAGVRR